MKKVLLPTDFSKNAYNAITYALRVYQNEACTFYLTHTFTPVVYYTEHLASDSSQIGLGDFHHLNAIEQLESLKKDLETKFKNPLHQFVTRAAFNQLVDEVQQMVEEENINVIIMGTQGATGARELLFGSNTVHVIKKANCPVIAVPSLFEYENPKEILFPTDFEINFKEKLLKELLHIGNEHVSRVDVLHVSQGREPTTAQAANKQQLEQLLKPIAHTFHQVPNNEIIAAINEFQLTTRINLLVMIKNKHSFLEQLFLKPIIKKLSFHVKIPFMVIPQLT